jgi:hypothetical protein
MVPKNVEADPEYARLLRDVIDDVYRQLGSTLTGMRREEAFIFISSPNAATPYHLDEEHNVLLQIRGSKEVFPALILGIPASSNLRCPACCAATMRRFYLYNSNS